MSREATLRLAELALDKGAYKECLSALESLLEGRTLLQSNDGYIGTLMVTALIGQGKNQQAISICETLLKHKNDGIRQQAKQFLSILKSPELERPEDWSIKIPSLSIEEPLNNFKILRVKKCIKYVNGDKILTNIFIVGANKSENFSALLMAIVLGSTSPNIRINAVIIQVEYITAFSLSFE